MSKTKMAYSKQFEKKMLNANKVIRYMGNVAHSTTKLQAIGVVRQFRNGLYDNSLGLESLAPSTLIKKQNQGYKKPSSPLVGEGKSDDRSYMNMLKIVKLKKGYSIRPSRKLHHSRVMTLRELFIIHEFGATIKRGDTLIRIPPRPALQKATAIVLKNVSKSKKEKALFKEAFVRSLNGDFDFLAKIEAGVPDFREYD